jgi:hypothetical protein
MHADTYGYVNITWTAEGIIGMRIPTAFIFHEIIFHFLFSTSSRPMLEVTQSPIQWILVALLPGKAAEVWSWQLTFI